MTQEPATLQLALMSAASWKLPKHVTYVRGRGAESCITYSDLLAEVSALAGWLAEQGVEHGEPVILAASSSPRVIVDTPVVDDPHTGRISARTRAKVLTMSKRHAQGSAAGRVEVPGCMNPVCGGRSLMWSFRARMTGASWSLV
jgi:hypothetical protein